MVVAAVAVVVAAVAVVVAAVAVAVVALTDVASIPVLALFYAVLHFVVADGEDRECHIL